MNKDEPTLVYVTKLLIDLFTETHPYFQREAGAGFVKGVINIFHIFRDCGFSILKTNCLQSDCKTWIGMGPVFP
jgi:hypothetical protein